jgi:hypothetical protein
MPGRRRGSKRQAVATLREMSGRPFTRSAPSAFPFAFLGDDNAALRIHDFDRVVDRRRAVLEHDVDHRAPNRRHPALKSALSGYSTPPRARRSVRPFARRQTRAQCDIPPHRDRPA